MSKPHRTASYQPQSQASVLNNRPASLRYLSYIHSLSRSGSAPFLLSIFVLHARILKAEKELNRFLIENGYKKGCVEKLGDYSEQKPVTEADKKLFDEACSSYQFPLGTPQTVGKRATADGTDYKFSVKSRGMDGKEASSTIYVTVEKGGKPEFTEVVR